MQLTLIFTTLLATLNLALAAPRTDWATLIYDFAEPTQASAPATTAA
jgi:hypothetical protein